MPQRTVYLGTSGFAAEVLQALAASEHRPQLAIAPPDRPAGRGRKLAPPPVALAAAELGIELLQTDDVNGAEAVERIEAAQPDVGVVCAFGQIVRDPLLSAPGLLNVHPSLLPRWRGAAPIERAMIAGDAQTGVTIMELTEGLDSGPIAIAEPEPIHPHDDHESLSARLAELGGKLMVRALDLRDHDGLSLAPQDEADANYAEKITAKDRRLDPARSAGELERSVRALTPHIGAYLELGDGERLGVREAELAGPGPAAGTLAADDGRLLLGTGDGTLRLVTVQPAGGRPMDAGAYLRGHGVPRL